MFGRRVWSVGLLGGLVLALTPGAAWGASTVLPIGVDHATPTGHNFEYTDFFPRGGLRVHQGDVVDFGWANTPDGLHTATLLRSGETPAIAWDVVHPAIESDADNGLGALQFSRFAILPSNPPLGAPGGCGDATAPCSYDGSSDVNSGANATDGNTHFFVRFNVPAGTRVTFICLIHRGMKASLTVVPDAKPATTAEQATAAADRQAAKDTRGAFNAEADANHLSHHHGHEVTLIAGTATRYVEVAEMLPRDVTIQQGQTVRWITKTREDPHTVTFPQGPAGDPLPPVCEPSSLPGEDVPATGSPPCGGDFANFEIHYLPDQAGATSITDPTTFGTSGVIATQIDRWHALGRSTSFRFPNTGTFTYQCKVHEHMLGTLRVVPTRRRH